MEGQDTALMENLAQVSLWHRVTKTSVTITTCLDLLEINNDHVSVQYVISLPGHWKNSTKLLQDTIESIEKWINF